MNNDTPVFGHTLRGRLRCAPAPGKRYNGFDTKFRRR